MIWWCCMLQVDAVVDMIGFPQYISNATALNEKYQEVRTGNHNHINIPRGTYREPQPYSFWILINWWKQVHGPLYIPQTTLNILAICRILYITMYILLSLLLYRRSVRWYYGLSIAAPPVDPDDVNAPTRKTFSGSLSNFIWG